MDGITESGAQLLSRLVTKLRPNLKNLSPEIIPQSGPSLKEIIEISGESNIGKTIHLMELIARTIIPQEFGGKGASAIVIDTNLNFHIPYLLPKIIEKHILHHRIAAHTSANNEDLRTATDNVQHVVLNSLKNIFLYKCYSSTDLELVLLNCADILTSNFNISLVAVDSIASFYWCDSANRQQPIRMETYLKQLQKQLRQLCNNSGIVAAYTKPNNFGNTSSDASTIEYRIALKPAKEEIREARMFFQNQQFTRNYTINDFGIQWISSRNK